jgi:hypothetical protein
LGIRGDHRIVKAAQYGAQPLFTVLPLLVHAMCVEGHLDPPKAKGVSPDDWLRFLKTAHASLYACSGMARKRPCVSMKTHL